MYDLGSPDFSLFYRIQAQDNLWKCYWCLWFAERGEVIGDHYKLLPIDLRDIQKLDDIVSLAGMDPR